ncbi:hypothetical protein BDV96DRAFT_642714 [Lophiotrema nucula]|uniref:EthD domain-containing protein n=1 Tax=Lophiotrema nucula TaxID=690887 RepID=A0A6A5ZLH2_9PLEO|nr:hypothetical protein BDV96DRAFT_642714 [Lophiotrema nucula]
MVHNKIDHRFVNPELEWDQKENYQPCIKLSFFFKKLPNVDDDHFQMHYNHVHSDLTVASKGFNVYKIQRYVQVRRAHPHSTTDAFTHVSQTYQDPEMKKKVESLGMELLDFDACSTIWVKSWDDWEKFSSSPEYAKALMPDADHFMDYKTSGIKVFAGHDLIVFGKAIPDCDATDGITRRD